LQAFEHFNMMTRLILATLFEITPQVFIQSLHGLFKTPPHALKKVGLTAQLCGDLCQPLLIFIAFTPKFQP
jgi:hypothetical protein